MTNRHIHKHCQLDADTEALLEQAMTQRAFSARSYTRILKVARTMADLAGDDHIRLEHVTEAIQYRTTERHYWRRACTHATTHRAHAANLTAPVFGHL